MKCTVTGDAVHRLRLRRQAGARQHPLRRRRHGVRRVPPRPAGRRRSTTSAAVASSNCSMLEAIALCEQIAGRELDWTLSDEARIGDHRWWISDSRDVRARLSRTGSCDYGIETTLREIHDANVERWTGRSADRHAVTGRSPRVHRERDLPLAPALGARPRRRHTRRERHRLAAPARRPTDRSDRSQRPRHRDNERGERVPGREPGRGASRRRRHLPARLPRLHRDRGTARLAGHLRARQRL